MKRKFNQQKRTSKKQKKKEIWRTVPSFAKYEVSTLGTIRNKKTKHVLSCQTCDKGYARTGLMQNGKQKTSYVHRLVALTFIPNPKQKRTVNHKDHNKLNNSVENLEWATTTEQNRHKKKVPREIQRLMSSRKVWRVDKDTNQKLECYETMRDAAKWVFDNKLTSVKEFNNGNNIKTKICAVCRKRLGTDGYPRKTAFGYKWEYVDEKKYENEIWKDIPKDVIHGVEGYSISSYGRIKNHKGRVSEGYHKPESYTWVSVYPKQYQLHRLIAKVFLPNFYGKPVVNHKDGNKQNNKLFNLEWSTYSENSQHAIDTGLNSSGKKIIVKNTITNEVKTFNSITSFCKYIHIGRRKYKYARKKNKLINGVFKVMGVNVS